MLSSKVLGNVTRRKSKSLLFLPKYSPNEKHMSNGVNALENNYNVTSKRQVNPNMADINRTNVGKLGSPKTQIHQPTVVGTLRPHVYMTNCHYSTQYTDNTITSSQHKLLGNIPRYVKIVEVGPRDGLQNEIEIVPTAVKIELIKMLVDSGLQVVEATSFVSPKWIQQLEDAKEVTEALKDVGGATFPVLTPHVKGFEAARAAGAKEVAVFASASESFSRSRYNCSIDQSLSRYRDVVSAARKFSIPVRGYISCVLGCPFEGAVHSSKVAYVAEEFLKMGCYEISLGDTIGIGTPGSVVPMIEAVKNVVPVEKLAVHFHDTYGQALSNILVSLHMGINVVDSSVSGLGGCAFARGSTGNVATEDVVYMLNGLGVKTNVDLKKLILAGDFIRKHLGRPSESKAARAVSNTESFRPILY